ncbi:MAG: class I SAM-dependent methyltransferase [Anaerolineae bacterium]|nr:MAG: class I SAM-dependent methyltransferase [Anaerolineae bacterium]
MGWRQRWNFWRAYLHGRTPWDTLITPPELEGLILSGDLAPGQAVDLGCGTGTNAIFMARHGWTVVGVDFAPQAILRARRRLAQAPREIQERVVFHVGDVTRWRFATMPFDFALDIGCLHALSPTERAAYVAELTRHTRHGAVFCSMHGGTGSRWPYDPLWTGSDDNRDGAGAQLCPDVVPTGEERGQPSGWYLFVRQ